jgi:hypothetical protein
LSINNDEVDINLPPQSHHWLVVSRRQNSCVRLSSKSSLKKSSLIKRRASLSSPLKQSGAQQQFIQEQQQQLQLTPADRPTVGTERRIQKYTDAETKIQQKSYVCTIVHTKKTHLFKTATASAASTLQSKALSQFADHVRVLSRLSGVSARQQNNTRARYYVRSEAPSAAGASALNPLSSRLPH